MVRLRSPAPSVSHCGTEYMGDFPSGQRGQTVNLLSLTSVVRIHHPPPTKTEHLSTDKCSVFVYPSRRLGISSPHNVRCISSAPLGLYLITRQRAFSLRLDEMQHCVLMICNSFGIDDIQGFALICSIKNTCNTNALGSRKRLLRALFCVRLQIS